MASTILSLFLDSISMLNVILSNTTALSTYLQGYKNVVVIKISWPNSFQGNDHNSPSTLGAIVLREKPSKSDNELTDNFYDLEKDLIQVDKRLFMQNNLCEIVPD